MPKERRRKMDRRNTFDASITSQIERRSLRWSRRRRPAVNRRVRLDRRSNLTDGIGPQRG